MNNRHRYIYYTFAFGIIIVVVVPADILWFIFYSYLLDISFSPLFLMSILCREQKKKKKKIKFDKIQYCNSSGWFACCQYPILTYSMAIWECFKCVINLFLLFYNILYVRTVYSRFGDHTEYLWLAESFRCINKYW